MTTAKRCRSFTPFFLRLPCCFPYCFLYFSFLSFPHSGATDSFFFRLSHAYAVSHGHHEPKFLLPILFRCPCVDCAACTPRIFFLLGCPTSFHLILSRVPNPHPEPLSKKPHQTKNSEQILSSRCPRCKKETGPVSRPSLPCVCISVDFSCLSPFNYFPLQVFSSPTTASTDTSREQAIEKKKRNC